MHIAEDKDISYAAAEEEVDQAILATIVKHDIPIVATRGYEETSSVTDKYHVRTSYGYWVSEKDIPNTGGVMSVRMSVYSVVISASVGRYISHVSDDVKVTSGSGGQYTIDATGNVSWDEFTVHLSSSGNAEIEYDTAGEIGMNAEWISFGISMGSAQYLRYPFSVGERFDLN